MYLNIYVHKLCISLLSSQYPHSEDSSFPKFCKGLRTPCRKTESVPRAGRYRTVPTDFELVCSLSCCCSPAVASDITEEMLTVQYHEGFLNQWHRVKKEGEMLLSAFVKIWSWFCPTVCLIPLSDVPEFEIWCLFSHLKAVTSSVCSEIKAISPFKLWNSYELNFTEITWISERTCGV